MPAAVNRPKAPPPRGILTQGAPKGPIEHLRVKPSPKLADYIEHFWCVRFDLTGQPPFVVETLPHPSVHVLFEHGRALVMGLSKKRFTRELKGRDRTFAIKFRPAAFQPV